MNGLLILAQGAANDWWSEQFFGLDQDHRFALLIIAMAGISTIFITSIALIASLINTLHRRQSEVSFKRDLIDRGFSAEEITKIIESAPPKNSWRVDWAKGMDFGART
jgi:hypothetical protein